MILRGFRFGMFLQFAVGPVCLFIFQTAIQLGLFPAIQGVIGVTLVDGLYILAAIVGLGGLINKNDSIKKYIKYFGGGILILFGASTVLGVFGISFMPSLSLSVTSTSSVFMKTMILTLSNPLTILFWAGVFSTKLAEMPMTSGDMYLFGSGAVLSTFSFLTLISIVGSKIAIVMNGQILSAFNIIVGCVLIAFGFKTLRK